MQRRILIFMSACLLAIGLAACGSSSKSSSTGSSSAADITISGTSFANVKPVKAGATVTIKNEDPFTHTVTSDDGTSFNVSIDGGKTATFTAPKAGTYAFHCNIHSSMHSSLTVT
jgi:plastocyanin